MLTCDTVYSINEAYAESKSAVHVALDDAIEAVDERWKKAIADTKELVEGGFYSLAEDEVIKGARDIEELATQLRNLIIAVELLQAVVYLNEPDPEENDQ